MKRSQFKDKLERHNFIIPLVANSTTDYDGDNRRAGKGDCQEFQNFGCFYWKETSSGNRHYADYIGLNEPRYVKAR